MNNLICKCGFIGNSSHARTCSAWTNEVIKITTNIQSYISKYYLTNYSIVDCILYVKRQEKTNLGNGILRKLIVAELKLSNLYQGVAGKEAQQKKQIKLQNTMIKKYGVINNGQREGHGRTALNSIPYKKLPMLLQMSEYRKSVEVLTKKLVQKLKKNNNLPTTCFYTNNTFNDNILRRVNPNDPLKRTVDHVVPITEAFLLGWPAEKCAASNNIVFCLRVVNSLKHNTDADRFKRLLVPIIKEKLDAN